MALGVNFANGFETSLPRRAMGLLPEPTWRSRETSAVSPFETRVYTMSESRKETLGLAGLTPSNVSMRLSSTSNALAMTLKTVLLSLRTSRAVLNAARGPLKMASTAA